MSWYNPFSWFRKPEPPSFEPRQMAPLVQEWRDKNQHIVQAWERAGELQRRRKPSIEDDPVYREWRQAIAVGHTKLTFEQYKDQRRIEQRERRIRLEREAIARRTKVDEPQGDTMYDLWIKSMAVSDDVPKTYEEFKHLHLCEPYKAGGGGDFGGGGATGEWVPAPTYSAAPYDPPAPAYDPPAPSPAPTYSAPAYDPPAPSPAPSYDPPAPAPSSD